jgi:transcriptional regulator with XRE-family HTH domain
METAGQLIRAKRESLGLFLRQVASYLDIDQAILSKIEHGTRKPTKNNIIKLSEILKLDHEDLFIQFMSEKIANDILEEDCARKILKLAERKLKYMKSNLVKH